jgi:hypothetical protein
MPIIGWLWWLYLVGMNPRRCQFCGKRGCSTIDTASGHRLWHCLRCGRRYYEWDQCARSDANSRCGKPRCLHGKQAVKSNENAADHDFVPTYEEIA